MTMITFNNQEERINFQIAMCLQMLKSEVETKLKDLKPIK
jgi:hypothetical protein